MNAQDMKLAVRRNHFNALHEGGHATLRITLAELACRGDEVEARAWEDCYEAAPGEVRDALGVCSERLGSVTLLMAPGIDSLLFNRAIGFGMTSPTTATSVAYAAKVFKAAGVSRWGLQVSSRASPESLADTLEKSGWRRASGVSTTKMIRRTGAVESGSTTLRVEAATTETIKPIVDAIALGSSMSSTFATWLRALQGREKWRVYGLFDGDSPVGGCVLFVEDAYAWMGMNGVVESHRVRGGSRALMARLIYDASRFGASWIATEATDALDGVNFSMRSLMHCDFQVVASHRNLMPPVIVDAMCETVA